MDRLYDAIASRVSNGRFFWTAGVLSGVAVAFGLALWCWTAQQCSAAQEAAAVVERRVIGMERDIEHIKTSQAEMKVEVRDGFGKLERKLERLLDAKPGPH
ncbi:MAG: hypothetical protein WC789_09290 [Lentisphaeria bacterium]